MNRRCIPLAFAVSLLLPSCQAQPCPDSYITNAAKDIAAKLQNAHTQTDGATKRQAADDAASQFRSFLSSATTVACAASSNAASSLAGALELRRMDVQTGASSGSSGSTSLTTSGSAPALLGMAVEYGGATEVFSGTTATFSTTPAKLLAALNKAYGPDSEGVNDRTLAMLQRVSFSVSFDTSRTSSADVKNATLLANYQQLSQATGRILLINDRDPLAAQNWAKIRDLSRSSLSSDLANQAQSLLGAADIGPDQEAAGNAYAALLGRSAVPAETELEAILRSYLHAVQQQLAQTPGIQARLNSYTASRLKLDKAHKDLYKAISKARTLSLEFDLNRPPVVSASSLSKVSTVPAMTPPDLFSAKLIYTASFLASDYTINAQANLFTETRPGMSGNFRDFQVSGKWDFPVGNLPSFIAKGTLTFSGLYEHLRQKPLGINLMINDQIVNQPGDIGIFQAKYSIPVGDSGIQVPISFTASNRTELIKERDVRGNIGITFDLDKLLVKK